MFFSPFSIAITSLGEERANLSAFRMFDRFVLVWICRFPLPLDVWEGLLFVIVALPGLFSYLLCPATKNVAGYYVIPSEILSVRPSVSAPTIRLPATPPTVLGQSFSNFTGAFKMV